MNRSQRQNSGASCSSGEDSNESTLIESLSNYLKKNKQQLAEHETQNANEESMNDLNSYFMNVAALNAKKRKAYSNQAGACIVAPSLRIVGMGHNTSSSKKPRAIELLSKLANYNKAQKPNFIYHAELNAILNKKEFSLAHCTIYVTEFPCIECAKLIIQSEIKKVVYANESQCQKTTREEERAARLLFNLSGVQVVEFK